MPIQLSRVVPARERYSYQGDFYGFITVGKETCFTYRLHTFAFWECNMDCFEIGLWHRAGFLTFLKYRLHRASKYIRSDQQSVSTLFWSTTLQWLIGLNYNYRYWGAYCNRSWWMLPCTTAKNLFCSRKLIFVSPALNHVEVNFEKDKWYDGNQGAGAISSFFGKIPSLFFHKQVTPGSKRNNCCNNVSLLQNGSGHYWKRSGEIFV